MTASYFSDYAFSFIPNQFYPIDSLLPSLIYKNTLLNTRQLAGGMKRGSPKAKGFL